MSNELTRHVLEVIGYGLSLKEKLNAGEPLLIDAENARLKQMLWADGAVKGHPDYGHDGTRKVDAVTNEFLGVRYALACWADEIIISDPACPWNQQWQEMTLEAGIFGGAQERAHRFWTQAEMAEKRPGSEALEAFLWCVMLGFRGDSRMVNPPEWVERVRKRVLTARQQEIRLPADQNLRTNVPALRGRDRFRTAARALIVLLVLGVFAATIIVTQLLKN